MKKSIIFKAGLFAGLAIIVHSPSWSADNTDDSALKPLLGQLGPSYSKACEIRDYRMQAQAFDEIVQLIDSKMNAIQRSHNNDLKVTLIQLKGLSLRQQAAVVHNQAITTKDATSNLVDLTLLRKAVSLDRQSCDAYQSIQDKKNVGESRTHLANLLLPLSSACGIQANTEKDPSQKLALLLEATSSITESYEISPTKAKEKELRAVLLLSLPGVFFIYNHLNTTLGRVSGENVTMAQYKLCIDSANLTNQLIQFTTDHLINPKIKFEWYTEPVNDSKPKKKNRKVKQTSSSASISSTSHPSLRLEPKDFIVLPWTILCGYEKYAASMMNLLATTCAESVKPTYNQRTQEHLKKAIHAYRQNVYKGEYEEEPTKEESFILARIEDIIGNPEPLKEFYHQQHAERKKREHQKLIQHIQTQQIERQQLEEHKKIEELEKREKAFAHRQAGQQSVIDQKEKEALPDPDTAWIEPSSEKDNGAPGKKPKVKRHGTPNLPTTSSTDKSSQSSSSSSAAAESVKIVLDDPNHFTTFQRLTGADLNRNVSLHEVQQLLGCKSIGCIIDKKAGKGTHGKATAKNGKVWIMPIKWDLPIPHYYRQQLSHYLQVDLEIDPECVVQG